MSTIIVYCNPPAAKRNTLNYTVLAYGMSEIHIWSWYTLAVLTAAGHNMTAAGPELFRQIRVEYCEKAVHGKWMLAFAN